MNVNNHSQCIVKENNSVKTIEFGHTQDCSLDTGRTLDLFPLEVKLLLLFVLDFNHIYPIIFIKHVINSCFVSFFTNKELFLLCPKVNCYPRSYKVLK